MDNDYSEVAEAISGNGLVPDGAVKGFQRFLGGLLQDTVKLGRPKGGGGLGYFIQANNNYDITNDLSGVACAVS